MRALGCRELPWGRSAKDVPEVPKSVHQDCRAKLKEECRADTSDAAEAIGIRLSQGVLRGQGECRRFGNGNDAAGNEISIRVAAGETNLAGPELVYGLA